MRTVRIGVGTGFYGDSLLPVLDTAERGEVDYLAFDHLAELTMAILQKDRQRHPEEGYAKDLGPLLRELLPLTHPRGVRLVSNAGGVNPQGALAEVARVVRELGLGKVTVGVVEGDDLLPLLPQLVAQGVNLTHMEDGRPVAEVMDRLLFARVYLGAQPVAEALRRGAEIVLTGRVADSALFAGPVMYAMGWAWDDWDKVAAAVLVGHLLECGGQASGGNFSGDWWNLPDMDRLGYPIAEVHEDASAILTKPPGTGGRVSVDTVKEQLLYEIHDPSSYLTPDVVLDLTGVHLEDVGPDRVRVQGARGRERPSTLKALLGYPEGYLAEAMLGYAWPNALRKARAAAQILRRQMERLGITAQEVHVSYLGYDSLHGPLTPPVDEDSLPEVYLRLAVRTPTREEARRVQKLVPPLALDGPPFIGGLRGHLPVRELMAVWPVLVDRKWVEPHVRVRLEEVGP